MCWHGRAACTQSESQYLPGTEWQANWGATFHNSSLMSQPAAGRLRRVVGGWWGYSRVSAFCINMAVSGWQLLPQRQLQLGFSCVAHKAVVAVRCQCHTKSGHWSSAAAVHLSARIDAPFVSHFKIVINFQQSYCTAGRGGGHNEVRTHTVSIDLA